MEECFYKTNFRIVHRPRTWGRGLHGIYDDDAQTRRHCRRFLSWHVKHSENTIRNIKTENGITMIPGFIRYSSGEEVTGYFCFSHTENGFRTNGVFMPDNNRCSPLSEQDMFFLKVRFYRHGIPNSYGEEAEEFDKMSLRENRYAYKIKHCNITPHDEIVAIAKKEHCSNLDKFETEKKYYEIPKKDRRMYEYTYEFWKKTNTVSYMKYAISEYHARILSDVEYECNRTRSTSGNSCRQLRALGFVA